jgi:hypothetical protein
MTAELFAIYQALLYLKNVDYLSVVIFTDSKSAIQHLSRCALGERCFSLAYKIIEQIRLIQAAGNCVRIQWVPSHIGLAGNEEADSLAAAAASGGTEAVIAPDFSEVVARYKSKAYTRWKEYFDLRSRDKGIWYRTMQCEPPRVPWFDHAGLSRADVVRAHRLRSGHVQLSKFAHLMGKTESPNCEECGIVEDVQHLLMECVRTRTKRETLGRVWGFSFSDIGVFHSILAEPLSEAAKFVYSFVNK